MRLSPDLATILQKTLLESIDFLQNFFKDNYEKILVIREQSIIDLENV